MTRALVVIAIVAALLGVAATNPDAFDDLEQRRPQPATNPNPKG